MRSVHLVAVTFVVAGACTAAPDHQSVPQLGSAVPTPTMERAATPTHVHLRDVEWWSSRHYPEELQRVYRYKALIGGGRPGVIPQADVLMGVLELAPGASYPGHAHPAPEIYYVVSGTAQWTVGDETFTAEAGTAIQTLPNTLHRMVNTGSDVLRAVYFWWAPDGQREVLRVRSELLEPVPEQPPTARFPD